MKPEDPSGYGACLAPSEGEREERGKSGQI